MIRVMIVDDHAIVREGIRLLLEKEVDMEVCGEAANSEEIFELLRNDHFDVILLDIGLPGRNGIELIGALKNTSEDLKILVLTMFPEEQYAVRAIRAGADGYLNKKSAIRDLIEAIRTVYQGKKYITSAVSEAMASELDHTTDQPVEKTLSNREYEVMCLIASGKTVSDIARDLSLSVPTISTYRRRILEKMNMKNNAELIAYVFSRGLVEKI